MTSSHTPRLPVQAPEGIKSPVAVATIEEINLEGLQVINGYQLNVNDRVLVKDQSDLSTNGIYSVQQRAWVRAKDWKVSQQVANGVLILDNNTGQLWRGVFAGVLNIGITDVSFIDASFTANSLRAQLAATDSDVLVGGVKASEVASKINTFFTVEQFGAVGDGVTDDTAAFQTVLDLGYVAKMSQGKTYTITQELQWKRGGGFISDSADWYPDTVQNGGRDFKGARILWAGAATTGAMLRMSATDIGVEQTSTFNHSVFGAVLRGIVIDGNDLVDYGLYAYRAFGCDVDNVIVTRTNKHGVYGTALYSGLWQKIMAWRNNGAGITFGRGQVDFGFSVAQLNAVTLKDIWGYSSGYNGLFDETTNPAEGYGVGIWSHRGNFISGIRAENNDGANFYWCPTSYSNDIQQVYTELGNSLDIGAGATAISQGRASQKISTIIEGFTGGVSYGNKLTYLSCSGEIIKLIGVNPSSARYGERFVIEGVSGGSGIDAAWSSYRLVDCNREMYDNITGSQPDSATSTLNGFVVPDTQIAGYATFTETGGTVTVLDSYNVTSVTGSDGTYNVNWDRDLQNSDYTVTTSFGDNRVVGVVTRSTTLTSVRHRTLTGTLTSATTAVTVIAYGRVVQ